MSAFDKFCLNYGLSDNGPNDTASAFADYCAAKYGMAPYLLSYDFEIAPAFREWWGNLRD